MKKLLFFFLGVMTTAYGMVPELFSFKDPALVEAYNYYNSSESDAVVTQENTGGEYCITAKHYKPEFFTYDCSRPKKVDEATILAELRVTSNGTGESFTVEFGHSLDLGHVKNPIICRSTYNHSLVILHSTAFNWSKKKKSASLSKKDGAAVLAAIASNLVLGERGGAGGHAASGPSGDLNFGD